MKGLQIARPSKIDKNVRIGCVKSRQNCHKPISFTLIRVAFAVRRCIDVEVIEVYYYRARGKRSSRLDG